MIYKVSINAQELLGDTEEARRGRANSCTAQYYRFDPENAVVDFVTSCAGSRNSWEQRVQMMDYNYIVEEEDRVEEEVFEEELEDIGDDLGEDEGQQVVTPTQPQQIVEQRKPEIVTFDDLKRAYPDVIRSDVRMFCQCPDFKMGGHAYILTQLDVHLEREDRYPHIKNPDLEGTVCKHLIAVLSKYFV